MLHVPYRVALAVRAEADDGADRGRGGCVSGRNGVAGAGCVVYARLSRARYGKVAW